MNKKLLFTAINAGYTLVELLVVILILGILTAISVPAFLNQANKARQIEGRVQLANINQQQSLYFLENGLFAEDFEELGFVQFVVSNRTNNYEFDIATNNTTTLPMTIATATPLRRDITGWAGKVYIDSTGGATSDVKLICQGAVNTVPDLSDVSSEEDCP